MHSYKIGVRELDRIGSYVYNILYTVSCYSMYIVTQGAWHFTEEQTKY